MKRLVIAMGLGLTLTSGGCCRWWCERQAPVCAQPCAPVCAQPCAPQSCAPAPAPYNSYVQPVAPAAR
jgi:hypothetical protein